MVAVVVEVIVWVVLSLVMLTLPACTMSNRHPVLRNGFDTSVTVAVQYANIDGLQANSELLNNGQRLNGERVQANYEWLPCYTASIVSPDRSPWAIQEIVIRKAGAVVHQLDADQVRHMLAAIPELHRDYTPNGPIFYPREGVYTYPFFWDIGPDGARFVVNPEIKLIRSHLADPIRIRKPASTVCLQSKQGPTLRNGFETGITVTAHYANGTRWRADYEWPPCHAVVVGKSEEPEDAIQEIVIRKAGAVIHRLDADQVRHLVETEQAYKTERANEGFSGWVFKPRVTQSSGITVWDIGPYGIRFISFPESLYCWPDKQSS